MADLAINQNGSLLINSQTNDYGIIRGYAFLKQVIYIAMVEMPPTLITSKQFKTIDDIENQLKEYLEEKISLVLPFEIQDIRFIINRRQDESISIIFRLPRVDNIIINDSELSFKYELREGYQNQLTYDFQPNIVLQPTEKEIMEIVNLKETVNRVLLNYRYSGRGTIKFYNIDDEPEINTSEIEIIKEPGIRRYSLYNYLENPDISIDTATIISGQEFLEKKIEALNRTPEFITFIDGNVEIFFKKNIPDGSIVNLDIEYSNALAFGDSVEVITKDEYIQTFGCKLYNNKYMTTLKAPLVAGKYKVIYWANIYYDGFYK